MLAKSRIGFLKCNQSARPHMPQYQSQGPDRIIQVSQNKPADDRIERTIEIQTEVVQIALDKPDAGDPGFTQGVSRLLQHDRRPIERHNLAIRANDFGYQTGQITETRT